MIHKLVNLLIIGACVATVAACAGTDAMEQDTSEITGIVATVNGIPIKKAEYKQELTRPTPASTNPVRSLTEPCMSSSRRR